MNMLTFAPGMSWVDITLIAAFALAVIAAILGLVRGHRCPECKHNWAQKKTGATEKGSWFTAEREEWICKYCGYREWKNKWSWTDSGGG